MKYKIFKETRIRNNGVKEYKLYAELWSSSFWSFLGINDGYLTPHNSNVIHFSYLSSIYWKIGEVNESEISGFKKNVETWIKDQKAMEISKTKKEVL